VELLAQTGTIAWSVPNGAHWQVRIQNIVFPPTFLAHGNASTLYSGLQRADESLSLDSLLHIVSRVDFVVVFLGSP